MSATPSSPVVFMVEPSASDRVLARTALARLQPAPRLRSFEQGANALEHLRQSSEHPDLLLLTLDEDRLAHLDVLRAVRRDPHLHELPVITLCSPDAGLVDLALAAGATNHFHKPTAGEQYGEVLRRIVSYWVTRAQGGTSVEPPRDHASDGEIRVLLVEDSVPDFYLFRRALRRAFRDRHVLTHTTSVSDALAYLGRERVDVVVTDLTLPDATGVDAVATLHPKAGEAPIVVLTGDHDPDTGAAALRAGADDYLVKSELTPSAIARSLTYALERRAVRGRLLAAANMRRVGLLAGTVAHDVNNVLTVVRSCAEALRDRPDDMDAVLDDLVEATERGRNLSRRLLAMGRQNPLERTIIDLRSFVGGLQATLERLGGSGITVRLETGSKPLLSEIDPVSLEQAVLSLVDNAVAAMSDGGTLSITTRREGDDACLEIRDTGEGIPDHVLPRVFEPFYTTRPLSEGSGIGLPSARETVRQHGGDIVLASTAGEGTRVRISLPMTSRTPEPAPARRQRGAPRTPDPRSVDRAARRILIVDDQPGILTSVRRALALDGHVCVTARTIAEALRSFAEDGPFHLVLTDLILLGSETGFDVVDALREAGFDGPVRYMSAYTPDQNNPRAELVPGQNFLSKPFDGSRIRSFVLDGLQAGEPTAEASD